MRNRNLKRNQRNMNSKAIKSNPRNKFKNTKTRSFHLKQHNKHTFQIFKNIFFFVLISLLTIDIKVTNLRKNNFRSITFCSFRLQSFLLYDIWQMRLNILSTGMAFDMKQQVCLQLKCNLTYQIEPYEFVANNLICLKEKISHLNGAYIKQ